MRAAAQAPRTGWTAGSAFTRRALAVSVLGLALIGVAAAAARTALLGDLMTVAEPYRQDLFRVLGLEDPLVATRLEEVRAFDARYAENRVPTLLHAVLGGVLLLLAPLQFFGPLRQRSIRFHRWSGRLLIVTTLVVLASGLFFGLLMPYAGLPEALATVLFGGFGAFAILRAFRAIRRGSVARHREWMIRAFAALVGIATIRVVGLGLDLALTPAGVHPRRIFALSLWMGWLLTLGAAEAWIRHTRIPHDGAA